MLEAQKKRLTVRALLLGCLVFSLELCKDGLANS